MSNTISKSEKAYQAIKQAIIAVQLESAKIYSIAELSETFEVGRTPAREALVILASEGLIDPIPRSDYQVTSPSIHDILEIFHLRSVLEVESFLKTGEIWVKELERGLFSYPFLPIKGFQDVSRLALHMRLDIRSVHHNQ
jgi:DNA-binding GntR family transcriptional regulator